MWLEAGGLEMLQRRMGRWSLWRLEEAQWSGHKRWAGKGEIKDARAYVSGRHIT